MTPGSGELHPAYKGVVPREAIICAAIGYKKKDEMFSEEARGLIKEVVLSSTSADELVPVVFIKRVPYDPASLEDFWPRT